MCIQLACSRRPRALEEAHCWNIQAKFYNKNFPLVYESDKTKDSLSWRLWCYFEAQEWQRIVALSLLSFSLIFLFGPSLFFMASFFFSFFCPESHPDLWGNHSIHHPFLTWYNALENDDHHTSIYLQLNDYNSILEQKMTLYECLRRCTGICNESRVTCMKELWMVALPQIRCQLHDHARYMTMMERVIINEMVESCMAIYLGMAMEMPW